MKIISIHRDPEGLDLPNAFIVGTVPIINGTPVEDNPTVSKISFYETGCSQGQVYRGPCYVVSFTDSNIKRVIPVSTVAEIAYERSLATEPSKEEIEAVQ